MGLTGHIERLGMKCFEGVNQLTGKYFKQSPVNTREGATLHTAIKRKNLKPLSVFAASNFARI